MSMITPKVVGAFSSRRLDSSAQAYISSLPMIPTKVRIYPDARSSILYVHTLLTVPQHYPHILNTTLALFRKEFCEARRLAARKERAKGKSVNEDRKGVE
ncbi:MAG: hypothetical protein KAI47_19990, partial [Deltaproteobacteria bacterium]|nr:hypothetical protein [Deltaproteobacteria bacterium]